MSGLPRFQLRSIISLLALCFLAWSCKTFEGLSRIGQNRESIADQHLNGLRNDFYKPLKIDRTRTREDDDDQDYEGYQNDAATIIDYGLAEYVNAQVSPLDIKCHNYHTQKALAERRASADGKECIPYDRSLYGENGGAQLASYIKGEMDKAKAEGRNETKAKKTAFYRAYGPLAVKVAEDSGYPASVLLAQWGKETAWGLSRLVRKGNGIAGHSCYKERGDYDYPIFKVPGTDGPGNITVSCTYKRPSNERYNYLTFKTLEESAYAQAHNVLFKESTKTYYPRVRAEVQSSLVEGRKANPYAVIDGLKSYAADPNYRSGLRQQMETDQLNKLFDGLMTCKESTDENIETDDNNDE